MEFKYTRASSKLDLLDKLLKCKLTAQQYTNYESILKKLAKLIDRLGKATHDKGHALIGIENGLNNDIILIVIEEKEKYTLYTWARTEVIERPLSFNIYTENYMEDTNLLINDAKTNTPLSKEEVISLMLTQDLTGYSLNNLKIKEYIAFSQSGEADNEVTIQTPFIKELAKTIKQVKTINKIEREKIISTISSFAQKQDCENLALNINIDGLQTDYICIGKITDIRQVGNNRHFKLEYISRKGSAPLHKGSVVASVHPGKYHALNINKLGEIYIADSAHNYYGENNTFALENFKNIPYNYVDLNREFLAIKRSSNSWKIIISGDPRVDESFKNTFIEVINRYIKHCLIQDLNLNGTTITDGLSIYDYNVYESRLRSELKAEEIKNKGIRLPIQTLQKMISEYKYIVKKHRSVGKDVYITDKVIYNHTIGKISYGDFSIATSDELMKSRLYDKFEEYLIEFYRGTLTEEQILNGLLDKFFNELKERMTQVTGTGFESKITINDNTEINLKVVKTTRGANLVYLNDQRFNRNEVLVVLREITCYRDKEEAKKFIANVGKLGLSVYIGITTGFELSTSNENKIYKFKKEKGRSAYKLILDDLELNIKGKKLISLLYNDFIENRPFSFNNKLEKTIFNSVESSLDYLKYKFLIDSSYTAFKEKSKLFLDKKIDDIEGERCTYLPKKRHNPLDAVKLTGISGNTYIVCYDSKESFVFINPQKEEKNDYWNGGKYICMVDQSNIKSNIGYDTVISKLMALKNDSLIAGTIYNLNEELENE